MRIRKSLNIMAIIILAISIFAVFAGAFIWALSYSRLYGEKEIIRVAQEIKGNETDPRIILNDIAVWLSQHMTYDASAIYFYPTFPFLLSRQVHPDAAWVMTVKRGACEEYAILCCELSRLAGIQSRIAFNTAEDHVWCEVFLNNSWIHFDPGLAENKRLNNSGFYEHPRPDGWGKQLSFVFTSGSNGEIVDITKKYTDIGWLVIQVERDGLPLENAKVIIGSRFLMETDSRYNKPLFCLESQTDGSGSCAFELGANNYTITTELGSFFGYRNQTIVHLNEQDTVIVTLALSNFSILLSIEDTIVIVVRILTIIIIAALIFLLYRKLRSQRSRAVLQRQRR